jgi:predicted flap endonuclease-1-like 5' DNA nuclease
MDWLSFLIGALVGLLVGWLIDILFFRPRRRAAEADLRAKVANLEKESASLRAELAGCKDVQVRLGGANAELDALKAELAGFQDLRVQLDGADAEIASLKGQLVGMADLQAELDASRVQLAQHALEIERLDAHLADRAGGVETGLLASAAAPEADLPVTPPISQPSKPDDLTIIEGIGPKINALLNENGIYTFAQLAATTVERLRSILSSGGPRFSIANPTSWAEQATLARDGAWDALKRLQNALKAGRWE